MESPLTNLSNVLATVRDSAGSYEPTLRKNEAATRAALIDPVLRALGWDIANPFMVEVETSGTFENKISADYALKTDGEIQLVVEAKKLGTDLDAFRQQVVKYSFGFGVNKIFLTDGIIWQHFDPTKFRPNDIAPIETLNLGADDLEEIAAYLVQELDAALISPQRAQIDLLSEEVSQLREEIERLRNFEERLKALEAKPDASIRREPAHPKSPPTKVRENTPAFSASWTPLTQLGKLQRTKPSNLRLPDETEIAVKSWGQVLLECCRYALQSGANLPMPLPDSAGKKTNLIQTVPFPNNVNSKEVEAAGRTFYVYVNYSADKAAENALYVLKAAGLGEAAVVYE